LGHYRKLNQFPCQKKVSPGKGEEKIGQKNLFPSQKNQFPSKAEEKISQKNVSSGLFFLPPG